MGMSYWPIVKNINYRKGLNIVYSLSVSTYWIKSVVNNYKWVYIVFV